MAFLLGKGPGRPLTYYSQFSLAIYFLPQRTQLTDLKRFNLYLVRSSRKEEAKLNWAGYGSVEFPEEYCPAVPESCYYSSPGLEPKPRNPASSKSASFSVLHEGGHALFPSAFLFKALGSGGRGRRSSGE